MVSRDKDILMMEDKDILMMEDVISCLVEQEEDACECCKLLRNNDDDGIDVSRSSHS